MILTHYNSGQTDVPPLYEGRASLAQDIPRGKADLKLSRITLQDNKVFSCRVQIPGDDEGKLIDSVRLVVLGDFLFRRIPPPPRMTSSCIGSLLIYQLRLSANPRVSHLSVTNVNTHLM